MRKKTNNQKPPPLPPSQSPFVDLTERGARIGPEQSSTGNRVGPRVSGNERLPGVVVLARERLLRKPGDAGHRIYIGVVYLVIITASPNLEVHKLDELPEQWRRFKLAWLCKELSSHNSGALIQILNAQKKWIRQEDTKNFDGQPDSIVRQGIENMVRSYIEKPNSIILAISPANQDLVTSDAIKISREVDPTGKRTLEVAG